MSSSYRGGYRGRGGGSGGGRGFYRGQHRGGGHADPHQDGGEGFHNARSNDGDNGSEGSSEHSGPSLRGVGERCITVPPLPLSALESLLRSIDGSSYGQLKQLTGRRYSLTSRVHPDPSSVSIRFLRIQPDPFAPGSQVCLSIPASFDAAVLLHSAGAAPPSGAAPDSPNTPLLTSDEVACRRVAAEDYVLRCVKRGLAARHGGGSGAIQVMQQSQHVLARSAVRLVMPEDDEERAAPPGAVRAYVHVYARVRLPGHGRRIDSRGIQRIFFDELLPVMLQHVACCDHAALWAHVTCVQDQDWLRRQLRGRGLVAFIADGAVLPRAAGDSDRPLTGPSVVAFRSPAALRQTFQLPYSGREIGGAGLPHGLTLIAGGGFHGKSTLLRALELGVYNHVPDDGRTFVVVDPTAVKIRAEDRRAVHGVDISPFITNLPFGDATTAFATADASGSTSQAANIMEALELGATTLLLDEDTSATNFMYRDALMEQLVPRTQEPITSFVHRVRDLITNHRVSVIMVVGGSGQYFPVADVVLVLNAYTVTDATAQAREIVSQSQRLDHGRVLVENAAATAPSAFHFPPQRRLVHGETFKGLRGRSPLRGGSGHSRGIKISGVGLERVRLADEDIQLALVEQLVEEGQVNAIAQCLAMLHDDEAAGRWDGAGQQPSPAPPAYPPSLLQAPPLAARLSDFGMLVYQCERRLRQARLEPQTASCYLPAGFTSLPRVFEIGAALNRLRTLITSCK